MSDNFLRGRMVVTVGVLLMAHVVLRCFTPEEKMTAHRPLGEIPRVLGAWQGEDSPLDQRILQVAGVDDYLNRIYVDGDGQPVALYVGYYGSQRTGDSIHSPKNCLPGAGWTPVSADYLEVEIKNGFPITVNEYLVEKGLDRELVLYWYQARGRVVASEYWGKLWQVLDAVTRKRTDGALVRIVTPVEEGEGQARARSIRFAQALYPSLKEFFPD